MCPWQCDIYVMPGSLQNIWEKMEDALILKSMNWDHVVEGTNRFSHLQKPCLVFQDCCNKVPQTKRLKRETCILSWFWMPEVQNEGAGRTMFSLRVWVRFSLACSELLVVQCLSDLLWLVAASIQSRPLSAHDTFIVCFCPYMVFLSSYKDTRHME